MNKKAFTKRVVGKTIESVTFDWPLNPDECEYIRLHFDDGTSVEVDVGFSMGVSFMLFNNPTKESDK